jgi:hypothetical protein
VPPFIHTRDNLLEQTTAVIPEVTSRDSTKCKANSVPRPASYARHTDPIYPLNYVLLGAIVADSLFGRLAFGMHTVAPSNVTPTRPT